MPRRKIALLPTQGKKFAMILAALAAHTPDSRKVLNRLTRPEGQCIYVAWDYRDIVRTTTSAAIEGVRLTDGSVIFVNVTEDLPSKKLIIDLAAQRLGYPAHIRNEIVGLMDFELSIADFFEL